MEKEFVTTLFWIGKSMKKAHGTRLGQPPTEGLTEPKKEFFAGNQTRQRFVPRQNPFYVALPYNDLIRNQFRPEAPLVIPWFQQTYTGPGVSVCRHRWVAIRKGDRTCYAQWEDCGPYREDHFQYVFQDERPKPKCE